MPGIHLAHGPAVGDSTDALRQRVQSLCHFEEYEVDPVYERDGTFLAATCYPEYPVETVETAQYYVVVEGKLYDVEDTRDAVADLARDVFSDDPTEVSEWSVGRDGVFLAVFVEKETGAVAVLNDAMGRLPTFVAETDDGVYVSRELSFCRQSLDRVTMDRTGVAQMLLFGYALDDRTQFEAVRDLDPATLLVLDGSSDGRGLTERSLHGMNFSEEAHAHRSIEENAARLAELFSEACRNRAEASARSVVSLSGGLDSRAIAACYHANDLPFEAVTFASASGDHDQDIAVASDLAEAFDVEWRYYELSKPTGRDLQTLLEMLSGTNYFAMAWILGFFERLRRDVDREASYIAGDGGQRALRDNTPPKTPESIDELVDTIVTYHSHVPIDRVARLTGITEDEIRDSVRETVVNYPETDLERKYVHYMITERGINFQYPGEDRNRFYFWNEGPHFAAPFFRYAVNCPTEQKRDTRLYQAFLRELSPTAVEHDYVNVGAEPGSLEYRLKMSALDIVFRYPRLKEVVGTTVNSAWDYQYDPVIADCLEREAESCPAVSDLFDAGELRAITDRRDSCGRKEIYTILTVVSAVEQALCEDSTLALVADRQFS